MCFSSSSSGGGTRPPPDDHEAKRERRREGERNVQASQLGQSVAPSAAAFFRISTDCSDRPTTAAAAAAELVQATAAGGAGEGEGRRRKEGVLGGKARKMMLSFTR